MTTHIHKNPSYPPFAKGPESFRDLAKRGKGRFLNNDALLMHFLVR
jgi:hypothetical protein